MLRGILFLLLLVGCQTAAIDPTPSPVPGATEPSRPDPETPDPETPDPETPDPETPSPVTPTPDPTPPRIFVTSTLQNFSLHQAGQLYQYTFTLSAKDPDELIDEGVYFVTVNRLHPDGSYDAHVAQDLFSDIVLEPDVFKQVMSGAAIRAGIPVDFTFSLSPGAAPGLYNLNFQLFQGSERDPNRVRAKNRLGTANFNLELVAR